MSRPDLLPQSTVYRVTVTLNKTAPPETFLIIQGPKCGSLTAAVAAVANRIMHNGRGRIEKIEAHTTKMILDPDDDTQAPKTPHKKKGPKPPKA